MRHFGYWVFGKDMHKVNLSNLKKIGVTDIFLNYYAFTAHGESKVLSWIKNAKTNGINTHIWVQCFYDGQWHNPKSTNLDNKLKEIKKYANMANVKGIHLDYLRYPGNAYKTTGGADAITNFVKKVRSQNPKIFLSCAVMPEENDKYYYGQDIPALGKLVDAIIPMQYKGNYGSGTSWLASTTKYFAKSCAVWSGLQAYKSDEDPTLLSANELEKDVKTCLSSGAKGVFLFRYGLSHGVNFKKFQTTTSTSKTISTTEIKTMASIVKRYTEQKKKIPSITTVNNKKYTVAEVEYILASAVINPSKAVQLFSIKNAPNPHGDTISEKLSEKDYTDVAKRTVNYIKTKKVCPNFSRTTKTKKCLKVDVVVYMLARIVNYYYEKKKMPKSALVSSKFFKTSEKQKTPSDGRYISSPHFLEEGAGYLGQINPYNCGPHSCRQALKKLGVVVSESTLASWAGTTTSGTDHEGINTAIAKAAKDAGVNIDVTWYNFSSLGENDAARFKKLGELISQKNVAGFLHILYSGAGDYYDSNDECGHYEMLDRVNINTKYVRALNSLGSRDGYGYYGHLQDRTFNLQAQYISGISQKSVCILKRK